MAVIWIGAMRVKSKMGITYYYIKIDSLNSINSCYRGSNRKSEIHKQRTI